jgi:hypothetical protein
MPNSLPLSEKIQFTNFSHFVVLGAWKVWVHAVIFWSGPSVLFLFYDNLLITLIKITRTCLNSPMKLVSYYISGLEKTVPQVA